MRVRIPVSWSLGEVTLNHAAGMLMQFFKMINRVYFHDWYYTEKKLPIHNRTFFKLLSSFVKEKNKKKLFMSSGQAPGEKALYELQHIVPLVSCQSAIIHCILPPPSNGFTIGIDSWLQCISLSLSLFSQKNANERRHFILNWTRTICSLTGIVGS